MEENKRLMIGCGNHIEKPINDCKKTPNSRQKDVVFALPTKYFYSHPPSKSPTINDKFRYNDYM